MTANVCLTNKGTAANIHLRPIPDNRMVGPELLFSVQNLQVASFPSISNKGKISTALLHTIPPCLKPPSPESVPGSKPLGESYHLVLSA